MADVARIVGRQQNVRCAASAKNELAEGRLTKEDACTRYTGEVEEKREVEPRKKKGAGARTLNRISNSNLQERATNRAGQATSGGRGNNRR